MLISIIRSWVFIILTFITLLLFDIYFALIQIFRPFPKQYRAICDVIALGEALITIFLRHVNNIKFTSSGVPFVPYSSSLVVVNHQCCFDWLFLWALIPDWHTFSTFKYVMKRSISKMPILGPVVVALGSFFLQRRWDEDQSAIDLTLSYYKSIDFPLSLVFFPEGTVPSKESISRSLRYSKDRSLPPFFHLLFPRTTGFSYLFNRMREEMSLECVYDITIVYEGPVPYHEKDFFAGAIPTRVHFHVERFEVKDVGVLGGEQWLLETWRRKEKRIRDFYWGLPQEEFEFVELNRVAVGAVALYVIMLVVVCFMMSRNFLGTTFAVTTLILFAHFLN